MYYFTYFAKIFLILLAKSENRLYLCIVIIKEMVTGSIFIHPHQPYGSTVKPIIMSAQEFLNALYEENENLDGFVWADCFDKSVIDELKEQAAKEAQNINK